MRETMTPFFNNNIRKLNSNMYRVVEVEITKTILYCQQHIDEVDKKIVDDREQTIKNIEYELCGNSTYYDLWYWWSDVKNYAIKSRENFLFCLPLINNMDFLAWLHKDKLGNYKMFSKKTMGFERDEMDSKYALTHWWYILRDLVELNKFIKDNFTQKEIG